jgi:hypothetical protein
MKKFMIVLLCGALSLVSVSASASVFDILTAHAGDFSFTGTTYVNTGTGAVGSTQRGIGVITSISDSAGNIIWSSGDVGSYLYYVFDDYKITSAITLGTKTLFSDTGGKVDFYFNPSSIFTPTGKFEKDALTITDNPQSELFLKTVAVADANGVTVEGIKSSSGTGPFSVSGGLLNVVGGIYAYLFNTNGIFGADMTFDISGNTVNTAGYTSRGSVSGAGLTTIPLVESSWLMLSGFLVLLFSLRRKT